MGIKYVENPTTLGTKILNRRLELGLFQKDIAELFGVSEDTITNWENERSIPQVQYYPKLIEYLGYFPFEVDTKTLGGKIKKYRFENGLTQEILAQKLGVNESTVFHYERNFHTPQPQIIDKLNTLII